MAEAQSNAHVVFNENADTISAVAIFGKNPATTTGLIWGYYGGLYLGNTVANGTVTLTDDDYNWVVVERSTGDISVSTDDSNATDALYAAIYKVTAVAGVVTDVLDLRMDANGLLVYALSDEDFTTILTNARLVPRRTSALASGECLSTAANVLVDTRAAGSSCSVVNTSGSPIDLTEDTGMTLRLAASATTGTLTLAAKGMAYLWYDTTTSVYCSGPGVGP